MEVKAIHRYAKISPLKARDVAREIQGLRVSHALDILNFTPRKAAFLIGKTLKSAVANAENNFELDVETLVVKEAVATDGPSLRRFKPRARGSAGAIRKRSSHISITLSDEIVLDDRKARDDMKKTAAREKAMARRKAARKHAADTTAPKDQTADEPAADESPAKE